MFTSQLETFSVALPGMWLMGFAPLFLVLSPNPAGAIWWNVVLTLGEVLWSPRNIAWQASLAPVGREGLFLALASAREHLAPLLDIVMGYVNEEFNPNCLECRDAYGHFCALANATTTTTIDGGPIACSTQHGPCPAPSGYTSLTALGRGWATR